MRIIRNTAVVAAAVAAAVILRSWPRGVDESHADDRAVAHTSEDRAAGPLRRQSPAAGALAMSAARSDSPRILSHPGPSPSESSPPQKPDPSSNEMSADQLRMSVEDRFEADKVDRDWAVSARHQAEAHLTRSLAAGSTLRSVECKATICRAEVEQPDLTAHQAFLRAAIASGAGWDGPAMAALEPRSGGAAIVTVVYLGRTPSSLVDTVPVEALDMPAVEDPRSR
jgi:hypothetical protein